MIHAKISMSSTKRTLWLFNDPLPMRSEKLVKTALSLDSEEYINVLIELVKELIYKLNLSFNSKKGGVEKQ